MKFEKIKNILLIIVLIMFTMCIVGKSFQNDTFFTIAIGQSILKNGIEVVEKMVWHEGLNFTNPRWLFDVLITQIYNHFNFCGIYIFVMIIASIQMIFYYYILNKITKKRMLSFIFTLIAIRLLKSEFAARAQLLSFPLFLLEFYSIEELLKTNKKRYYIYLTIIPFLLVNFHSSVYPFYFLFFVPYIIEYIFSKMNLQKDENSKIIIEKNKILKFTIFFIIGILAAFFVPKGVEPFAYIFKNLSGYSSEFILELQPLYISHAPTEVALLIVTIAIIAFTKTKVKLTDCFFILGFFILGISVIRSIFFYYLISTICIARIISTVLDDYNIEFKIKNKNLKRTMYISITTFLITYMIYNASISYNSEYVERINYPVDAAEYILKNVDTNNMRLFNHFNFGSYLEFKGIKTFIDSRSEIYTTQFNKNCTILKDWNNTQLGNIDYKETFEKYGITHALLYKTEVINQFIDDDPKWKNIYEDDEFVLYEKQ